jgi:hypothetical protein
MSKIMLVTGGGRGIGAATARLAAKRGYAVCVNYAGNAAAAEAVVEEIRAGGGRAFAHQADVASEDEVEGLFAALDREFEPITALVNNAGLTGRISRLDAISGEILRRVVEVNVLGVFYCARAAVRRMSTKHGGAGGAIVNISSIAASLGSPGEYTWYAATNHRPRARGGGRGYPRERGRAGHGGDRNSRRGRRPRPVGTDRPKRAGRPLRRAGGDCRAGAVAAVRRGPLHHRRYTARLGRPLTGRAAPLSVSAIA